MRGETNMLATSITELFSAKQWYKYLPWEERPTCWPRESQNCSQSSNGTSTYHEKGDQQTGHKYHRTVLSQAMVQVLTMRGETNMLATRITELFSAKQWYKYLPWEGRPTCWPQESQNCSQPDPKQQSYCSESEQSYNNKTLQIRHAEDCAKISFKILKILKNITVYEQFSKAVFTFHNLMRRHITAWSMYSRLRTTDIEKIYVRVTDSRRHSTAILGSAWKAIL